MLSLIKWVLKTSIFTLAILISAQLIHWNGKTLSEHVRAGLSNGQVVKQIAASVRSTSQWTYQIIKDANLGAKTALTPPLPSPNKTRTDQIKSTRSQAIHAKNDSLEIKEQELAASEREKLKDLIKELNAPQNK